MSPIIEKDGLEQTGDVIRLPDDVTVGYIVEHLLGVQLTVVSKFHSHLEALKLIPKQGFKDEVSSKLSLIYLG